MRVRVGVRCLAVLIALVAITGSVLAQEGGRNRRGPPPETSDTDTDRGAREHSSLSGEFDTHLLGVQKRLKLQAGQQAAWDVFAERVQALMQDQLRGMPIPPEHEDALHQINRRVDVVRNRLAAMEDIADAAARLYASLTPEQRKAADDLLPTTVPTLYSGIPPPQSLSRKPGRGG